MSQKTILVVDDEHTIADTLVAILEVLGWHGRAAYSAEEALEMLATEQPALLISDVVMPGGINGVELALAVRRRWPNVQILLVSGNAVTKEIMDTAHSQGHSFELLAKPVPPKQLLIKIADLVGVTNNATARQCVAASA